MDQKNEQLVEIETDFEVVAVGCKSRFCPQCCKHLGIKLRESILPVLKTFTAMMMLTLTIDPKLFPTPEHAYRYVRKRRCVAELVRALHKAGHLRSRRFFYVVEWQKNSEMAHFHLLVESDFIPFDDLAEFWGRFRPKGAGPPQGNAPAFGHVNFSKKDFLSPEHAANYACKYLTKLPAHGFPQWVLDFKGQIRMFATSRELIPRKPRPAKLSPIAQERPGTPKFLSPEHAALFARRVAREAAEQEDAHEHRLKPLVESNVQKREEGGHSDICFCECCRGEIPAANKPEEQSPLRTKTVGDRLKRCGQRAALVGRPLMMKPDGELVKGAPYFVEALPMGFQAVRDFLGREQDTPRRIQLEPGEKEKLAWLRDHLRDVKQVVSRRAFGRVKQRSFTQVAA